jgi:Flp pilus assembly protein TadB
MADKVSVSALLSIAVALLTMGVNLLQGGQLLSGVVCVVVGFGLIWATIALYEKGLVTRVARRVSEELRKRSEG